MIKTILLTLFQLLGLILLMTAERVIGLPFLSLLLGLIWLEHVNRQTYFYPVLLLLLSFLLAVSYDFSWIMSYLLWLGASQAVAAGEKVILDKKRRFLIVVITINLLLLWWLQLATGYLSLIQFIASYLLVTLWLRVFDLNKLQAYHE